MNNDMKINLNLQAAWGERENFIMHYEFAGCLNRAGNRRCRPFGRIFGGFRARMCGFGQELACEQHAANRAGLGAAEN